MFIRPGDYTKYEHFDGDEESVSKEIEVTPGRAPGRTSRRCNVVVFLDNLGRATTTALEQSIL